MISMDIPEVPDIRLSQTMNRIWKSININNPFKLEVLFIEIQYLLKRPPKHPRLKDAKMKINATEDVIGTWITPPQINNINN